LRRFIFKSVLSSALIVAIFSNSALIAGDLGNLYLFWLIKPKYDDAGEFSEGLASVKYKGKWGFINKQDKMIIEPQFDCLSYDVLEFHEGLAAVKKNKKWGFIDKTGKVIIEYQFDNCTGFSEGIAAVMTKGLFGSEKWGYINKQGEYLFKERFQYARKFSEGLASVKTDGKFGYIDKNGGYVIAPQFQFANEFYKGIALAKLGGTFINIDKKGKTTSKFSRKDEFPGGMQTNCRTGKCGYVNRRGDYMINPQFESAYEFREGAAKVQMKGKWGYLSLP